MTNNRVYEGKDLMFKSLSWKRDRREKEDLSFGKCLVIGLGGTAGTLIPLLSEGYCSRIDLFTAMSPNGKKAWKEMNQNGGKITSTGKIEKNGFVNSFFLNVSELANNARDFDTIFLCIPNQKYAEVVRLMTKKGLIKPGQRIVGISTRLGSGDEIKIALSEGDLNPNDFCIVSLSTYWGGTKPTEDTRVNYLTRALKKRIFVGFSREDDEEGRNAIREMLKNIGVHAEILNSTLKAEVWNANTYVHAQLTMTSEALPDIFTPDDTSREYIYRPSPEGCLSLDATKQMGKSEREINTIFKKIGLGERNLLDMLLKDLYPIPDFATEEEIKSYPSLSDEERGLWLHKWFIERQYDPETGKDHLRKVKLQKVKKRDDSVYEIPRIPGEDYYGVALLCELGDQLDIETSVLSNMRSLFESSIRKLDASSSVDIEKVSQDMEDLAHVLAQSGYSE